MTASNGDRRVEDRNTRDTAVRAESLVNAHMVDCSAFRLSLERKLDAIGENVEGKFSNLDMKLNKMQVWMYCIIGALMIISKLWDKIHF